MDTVAQKKALRAQMTALRENIALREQLQQRLSRHVQSFCRDYDRIFIYNSFGAEAETKSVYIKLIDDKKQVFMPAIRNFSMVAVQVFEDTVFTRGVFGIEEPSGEAYTGEISLCLCPGLAFTRGGLRLGYGKGYYDRFLAGRKTVKAGICFFEQLADTLPSDENDVSMDYIITPRGILNCAYADRGKMHLGRDTMH